MKINIKQKRFFFLAMTLLILGGGIQNAYAELSQDAVSSIKNVFSPPFSPGGPYFSERDAEAFVKEKGPEAIPVLIVLLKGELPPRAKGKVAFYLGKFKKTQVIQPLIELIEKNIASPVNDDEFFLLRCTMIGLGFTDNPKAYDYLKKLASIEYWQNVTVVSVNSPHTPSARLIVLLRQSAVYAMSVTQSESSLVQLKTLKENAPSDLVETIDACIRTTGQSRPAVGMFPAVP